MFICHCCCSSGFKKPKNTFSVFLPPKSIVIVGNRIWMRCLDRRWLKSLKSISWKGLWKVESSIFLLQSYQFSRRAVEPFMHQLLPGFPGWEMRSRNKVRPDGRRSGGLSRVETYSPAVLAQPLLYHGALGTSFTNLGCRLLICKMRVLGGAGAFHPFFPGAGVMQVLNTFMTTNSYQWLSTSFAQGMCFVLLHGHDNLVEWVLLSAYFTDEKPKPETRKLNSPRLESW